MIQTLPRLSTARPLPEKPVLKVCDLGGVGSGEARDVVGEDVGDPDVVLLVDGEREG